MTGVQTCALPISAIRILSFEGACKANTDQGLIDLTPLGQRDGGPR